MTNKNLSLLGGVSPLTSLDLTVFCDERKMEIGGGEGWWYICMLMVPSSSINDVVAALSSARDERGYHDEMSFGSIRGAAHRSPKTAIAKEWLRLLQAYTGTDINWKISGIATHNLGFSYFGPGSDGKGKYANVYNRFFWTAFLYCINTYFSDYDTITINDIFHDTEGNLQHHQYFDWHLPQVVRSSKIEFVDKNITFVVSDHHKEKEHEKASILIQLADIFVGSVSQRLDESSGNRGKIELGDYMTEMLNIASNGTWQAGKDGYSVSFFPSQRVGLKGLERALAPRSGEFFQRSPRTVDQPKLF